MLGLDNGVARRWLHSGAWVAALMAGRRAGSRAKGRAVPFIGKGGGGGRAGGNFAGEDGAGGGAHGRGSSAGHGSRRGERRKGGGAWRALVAPGKVVWGNTRGARGGLGLGLGTCPPRWPAPAYGVASGRGAGRREVEEPASGNLVNKPKFQNQFCNFKFSPSSWLQMKKC